VREGDAVKAKLTAVIVVLGMTVLTLLTGCVATNSPPVASFAAFPSSGAAPLGVSFDASASYDSDGSIVSYEWDFRDGHFGVGETSTHTFNTAGTYSAKLTVTDSEGARASVTHSITVTEAPSVDYRVTAGQLLDDYDANEVAADMKYKGKLIAVTGSIYSINVNDFTGEPYVNLVRPGDWFLPFTVRCEFSLNDLDELAQLHEDDMITIVGVCTGDIFFGVQLEDCYIE
jgi:PKD repeat protein